MEKSRLKMGWDEYVAGIVSLTQTKVPLNILINTVVSQRTPTQNSVAAKTPAKYG